MKKISLAVFAILSTVSIAKPLPVKINVSASTSYEYNSYNFKDVDLDNLIKQYDGGKLKYNTNVNALNFDVSYPLMKNKDTFLIGGGLSFLLKTQFLSNPQDINDMPFLNTSLLTAVANGISDSNDKEENLRNKYEKQLNILNKIIKDTKILKHELYSTNKLINKQEVRIKEAKETYDKLKETYDKDKSKDKKPFEEWTANKRDEAQAKYDKLSAEEEVVNKKWQEYLPKYNEIYLKVRDDIYKDDSIPANEKYDKLREKMKEIMSQPEYTDIEKTRNKVRKLDADKLTAFTELITAKTNYTTASTFEKDWTDTLELIKQLKSNLDVLNDVKQRLVKAYSKFGKPLLNKDNAVYDNFEDIDSALSEYYDKDKNKFKNKELNDAVKEGEGGLDRVAYLKLQKTRYWLLQILHQKYPDLKIQINEDEEDDDSDDTTSITPTKLDNKEIVSNLYIMERNNREIEAFNRSANRVTTVGGTIYTKLGYEHSFNEDISVISNLHLGLEIDQSLEYKVAKEVKNAKDTGYQIPISAHKVYLKPMVNLSVGVKYKYYTGEIFGGYGKSNIGLRIGVEF